MMPACRPALLAAVLVCLARVAAEDQEPRRAAESPPEDPAYQMEKPSDEVRRAIRLLLSSDRND